MCVQKLETAATMILAGAYLGIKARALTLLYTGAAVEVGAAMTVAAQLAAADATSCHTVSQRVINYASCSIMVTH